MEANVILAKCSKNNRTFGIRVEKRENEWVRTWAFPIDEAKAKREGFDRTKINGSLRAVDRYPGCPYCENYSFVKCGCEKVSCYKGSDEPEEKPDNKYKGGSFLCNWCGALSKEIITVESITVKAGDF